MIDHEKKLKEAEEFNSSGDCYIHVEMKNGKKCERLVGGDGLAIIHGLVGVIEKIGELTGNSFDDTMMAINEYKYKVMGGK